MHRLSKRSASLLAVGALFLFTCGVWSAALAQESSGTGFLTVAMLDVGQGDALYIESPTGIQILLDAGPGSAVLRVLPAVMPMFDRSLDAVIATHPDADHISGFVDVLERYEVGAFVYPAIAKDTATAKKIESLVDEQSVRRVVARAGMTLELGDGVLLEVLYPDRDVTNIGGSKANEGGVVVRLTHGEASMLFMADVSSDIEEYLLQKDDLDSDVLKVGHHGSRFSTADEFVQEVSPDVALISVGEGNTYGHPTPQALGILEKYGAKVMRTDEKGTVLCVSDGASFNCE